jgi:hypothetical protein
MALWSWLKLLVLEQRLHSKFGKYNYYRCLCLERNAKSSEEKLCIANEVWDGPSVNTMAAQANELYLRRHASEPRADSTEGAKQQRGEHPKPLRS